MLFDYLITIVPDIHKELLYYLQSFIFRKFIREYYMIRSFFPSSDIYTCYILFIVEDFMREWVKVDYVILVITSSESDRDYMMSLGFHILESKLISGSGFQDWCSHIASHIIR